eukprot:915068-Amorphochlora_amoeboformis.AAC.1
MSYVPARPSAPGLLQQTEVAPSRSMTAHSPPPTPDPPCSLEQEKPNVGSFQETQGGGETVRETKETQGGGETAREMKEEELEVEKEKSFCLTISL